MSHRATTDDFYPSFSTADWGGRSTRAEVSLDAISANIRALRRHVRGAHLMAVVKANGYGHGAVPVARVALQSGATRLAVYTVDEGVGLRLAGVDAPILVFGPFGRAEARDLVSHGLTATITSLDSAALLAEAAARHSVSYHLKVDTGLTRAGVAPEEVVSLVAHLRGMQALQPEGIYTHFARADEAYVPTTAQQLALFHAILRRIQEAKFSFPIAHAANSAGALAISDGWFDMVRVGIAMYGYYPSSEVGNGVPLRPALSLHSTVARITAIDAGTGVGYGHAFHAERPSRIALVPVGYGDGLHRSLGHGVGEVLVRGRRAPIVGRVSMDQITVDVTRIASVEPDDAVVIIGSQGDAVQSADDLAARINTISYEILTSLQQRVPRLYGRDGRMVAVCRHGDLRTLRADDPQVSADG